MTTSSRISTGSLNSTVLSFVDKARLQTGWVWHEKLLAAGKQLSHSVAGPVTTVLPERVRMTPRSSPPRLRLL